MTMRILFTADPIIPVPPTGYGGIERIIDALIRHYRAAGHQVCLLAHPDSSVPVDAGYHWPDLRVSGAVATLRNGLALRRAVRAFAPDVVHSFSRLAYLLPLLPTRQPVVMSYQRHTGGRQLALAARLGGRTLQFTGCSEFICGMGRPQGGRWTAVPNFVELEKLPFLPAVPADAPLVFLSRLDDIKGPDLAIAIARASGRRLILAGNHAADGPQRAFFDREIKPWIGRDGIEWAGEVGDEAKARLLGGAAAMLVPIRWNEPFGIVFPEALACGTPVITCARGALPEIIAPGRTGFFIEGLADGVAAVRRLGELDRAACRRAAEERFSLPVCAPQYLALYRSLQP
ncbi:MAG: glycosyltransferase [Lacunisphaera sp.]|nr:glycosyltransferase [Lacunisphaera sp.]